MKNRLIKHGIAIIGIAVLAFLSLASANLKTKTKTASTTSTSSEFAVTDTNHWGVFGEVAIYPMKDFETCGMVFTEHVYQPGAVDADVFTYQALLKEAQKLGADAIINVTIDRWKHTITTETIDTSQDACRTVKSTYIQETWYGSALAIKYTNVVLPQESQTAVPVNDPREPSTGRNASTDQQSSRPGLFGQR